MPVKRRYSRETQLDENSHPQRMQEGPSELPPWTDTPSKEDTPAVNTDEGQRPPMLSLPAPLPAGSVPWATLKVWNTLYVLDERSSRVIAKRTVKSVLLIYKVCRA